MYVVCGRVIKFCDTLWVKLGFASLHSLYLLYTKLGEKANFGEVATREKIRVAQCRGGEKQNEKLGSGYVVARPRGFSSSCTNHFPKPSPLLCILTNTIAHYQKMVKNALVKMHKKYIQNSV